MSQIDLYAEELNIAGKWGQMQFELLHYVVIWCNNFSASLHSFLSSNDLRWISVRSVRPHLPFTQFANITWCDMILMWIDFVMVFDVGGDI